MARKRSKRYRRTLWYAVYRERIWVGSEQCRNCRTRGDDQNPLTFDHLRPVVDGHELTFDNATILCLDCNRRKGANRWPHLRTLAEEERAAPACRQWYRLELQRKELEGQPPLTDLRVQLESAVRAYRHTPDPAHLAVLNAAGLDGIARALEVEATCRPGIGKDDATARIDGWLQPPAPASGPADRRAGGDGYGLGASSPTA